MLKFTRFAAIALIAVAVILALVAFVVGRRAAEPTTTVLPAATASAAPQQTVMVVEASTRLTAGTPIEASQVRVAGHAQASPGAYLDTASVIGLVPTQDIPEGSILQRGQLAQGFSLQLRPGERALAVPVDELAGAGNRILPGDFVDVFLNLKSAQSYAQAQEQAQTRLLLSRLRVLSYGQQDLQAQADQAQAEAQAHAQAQQSGKSQDQRAAEISGNGSTASGNNGNPANQAPARTAVLAVPVAEANRLLLGAQQGKLFLALRHPSDTAVADPSLFPQPKRVLNPARGLDEERVAALAAPENDAFAGIDGDALAGRSNATPAAAPATARRAAPTGPRTPSIEIIRGTGGSP